MEEAVKGTEREKRSFIAEYLNLKTQMIYV